MKITAVYFKSIVEPTVNDFLSDLKDVRKGCLAAIVLCHTADYVAEDRKQTVDEVRNDLTRQCPMFALIRDVADATKHTRLNRRSRQLTDSSQISRTPGLFEAPFGFGYFNEAVEVFATLDDGTTTGLEAAVRSVMQMFLNQLSGH